MTKSKKLWQVKGVESDAFVDQFIVGDDFFLDGKLLPFDIKASKAHAKMLEHIGVLDKNENKRIQAALDDILELHKEGKFEISREQEDCHTAIEEFLTKKCGDSGKKIHTGRSRNDQVLVATRLFMQDALLRVRGNLKDVILSFKKAAKSFHSIEMPGYTHYQKAMPTTAKVWLESFSDSLSDSNIFLDALEKLLDQNPLGSASGFGIRNFDLDREFTSKELGFSKVQENPIYCGFSRGYFENIFLSTLEQITISLLRFSTDLLLFSTQEFNFIEFAEIFTTGSSIMPQKRNPDAVEIMQGKLGLFFSKQNEIRSIITKVTSGYHREFQLVKKPFFEALEIVLDSLKLSGLIVEKISFKKESLKKAMTEDLFVTEKVYELVKKGMPFRDAYREIKKEIL